MHPHNLHLYYFSPTGGTKTAAGLFAEQLGAPDACTDITVHAEAKTFTADDRLLLFFPVYGGRVPEPCLARVRALRGADTPVTLVAVFGNRAVDDALLEMRDTLAPLGFRVVAAAEVIAPHSINTDIAAGRPDASDRARIAAFCAQLASKLAEVFSSPHMSPKKMIGLSLRPQAQRLRGFLTVYSPSIVRTYMPSSPGRSWISSAQPSMAVLCTAI